MKFHSYVHAVKKLFDGGEMLLCKDFCGSHDTCLEPVAKSYEHGHECHKSLAAAHVALQQTVHLSSGAHVVANLVHHPFLCSGKLKFKVLGVEAVEVGSYAVEYVSAVFAAVIAGVAQYVELHVEEFLKLESLAGLLHLNGIF